jgi:hypothetical protein
MPNQQRNLEEQFSQPSVPKEEITSPPVSPPPHYFSEIFPAPKPKISLVKIIIGVIIVVLLGVGTSLAARIWDPLWNPFRPEPEKVISKMTEKMKEVKTLHTDLNAELNIKNESEYSIKGKFWADGDNSDPKNLKSVGGMDINFAGEGMQFFLGLETKQIGETSYIKLTTIPALPLIADYLAMIGINLNEIKNQWIKTDKESLKKLLGEEYYEKLMKEQKEQEKKQTTMVEEFKKIIENKKFYLVKKELPDEKLGDKKVYHYLVVLNIEEIKKIIPEIMNIVLQEKEPSSLSKVQIEEMLKQINDFFDKVGELSGELWIGKRDNLLYRFKGEKVFDLSNFAEGEKGTILIKLNIDLSKFNQPVSIEAPGQYKNLDEILSPLLGQYGKYLGEAQTRAKDARIIADMSQLRIMAELIYDEFNSYENLCEDKGKWHYLNKNAPSYGKDLAALEEDIVSQGAGAPLCYDSATSYCVTVSLISPDRGKWCIDSSLASKEIGSNEFCLGNGSIRNPFRCPGSNPSLEFPLEKKIPLYFPASILNSILKIFKK